MNMKKTRVFSFSREFSRVPAGITVMDGPRSAEEFKKNHLIPLCEQFDKVVVDLSGTLGFASSFLEYSFGNLESTIACKIEIQCDDDPTIVKEVKEYMNRCR